MHLLNVWLTAKDPAQADEIAELLRQLGRRSREEPGCLRFEVYRSQGQRARFLLVERWTTREAWETHRRAAAVTEIYQPRVLPLVEREPHECELVE